MPALSQDQQKAAGIALAAKRGDIPKSKLRGASKSMYGGMDSTQLGHFAHTKRKGLPAHKSKALCRIGLPESIQITFHRDTDAMVQGGAFSFGAFEERYFEKGTVVNARSVNVMPRPDTDMSKIVLEDGTVLIIPTETFEATQELPGDDLPMESQAAAIVSHLLDEDGPGEEAEEVNIARNIIKAVSRLNASLPNAGPDQQSDLTSIQAAANALIRMHKTAPVI